jgi:A/G-specific adenine glycosylase
MIGELKTMAGLLMGWFEEHGRKFPWRGERDLYKLLVTELLLQRTRADMVSKIYREFFEKYPNVEALALAKIKDLKEIFSRLGLVYRSKRVKQIANEIVEKYGGVLPCDIKKLFAMRGIGVYTVSALFNFGCGYPMATIDGNVMRIFGRMFGVSEERRAREIMRELYKYGDNRILAYALIDIGFLICRRSLCERCPLKALCPKLSLPKRWRMMSKTEFLRDKEILGVLGQK